MNEKAEKILLGLQRYFINLLRAVCGRNPYREDLDELIRRYEKASANVERLNDMYYKLLEKWDGLQKRVGDYQVLIENLRVRIREKDDELKAAGRSFGEMRDAMERDKAELERRCQEYSNTIDMLQGELRHSSKR